MFAWDRKRIAHGGAVAATSEEVGNETKKKGKRMLWQRNLLNAVAT